MDRDAADPKRIQLFVAADIPPAVREAAAREEAKWRERIGVGRWVPPENWHVTVAFLGRVEPRLVEWIEERLAEVAGRVPPFETALDSFGTFPRRKSRVRVLWIGLDDRTGGWSSLAQEVGEALAEEVAPDASRFVPHLTLARLEPPIPIADHRDALRERLDGPSFEVGSVVLYRTHLTGHAPKYEPLASFPLRG